MSDGHDIRAALIRLERTNQLVNLRGSVLNATRLADLAGCAQRAGLFEKMLAYIERSRKHAGLSRRTFASPITRWLVFCGHGQKHTPHRGR
jgi:hypothetical protein